MHMQALNIDAERVGVVSYDIPGQPQGGWLMFDLLPDEHDQPVMDGEYSPVVSGTTLRGSVVEYAIRLAWQCSVFG